MSGPTPRGHLLLYLTPAHPCSYMPGRESVTAFVDPTVAKSPSGYSALARRGFRRSGEHIYRPHCGACRACVAVRIPVAEFAPRRSQRRVLRANRDVSVRAGDESGAAERFDLYRRYLASRHHGGGMDDPTPEQYRDFLTSGWSHTVFHEFRVAGELQCVAVTDHLDDGLSAVYTFFDPGAAPRAPGVHAILWQIGEARRLGLRWLYLGYWIEDCAKMDYKREYLPQERLLDGEWRRIPPG